MITKILKPSILLIILTTSFFRIQAQSVEVQGDLKVSTMVEDNTAETLVIRMPDGTLATRDVNTLPSQPFCTDTVRTLGTDIELAKQLCECGSIPPFMVNSMLDAGYTVKDLMEAGTSSIDLLEAGVPYDELYQNGVSLNDLLTQGTPLRLLLNQDGMTTFQLLRIGYTVDQFIGLEYQGGIIFEISGLGEGKVVTKEDVGGLYQWGCSSISIGPDARSLDDGESNTAAILANCSETPIAASVCDELIIDGYDDWYLPAIDELHTIIDSVGPDAGFEHFNRIQMKTDEEYWSSTEVNSFFNQVFAAPTNGLSAKSKTNYYRVRAIRKFSHN